MNESMRAQLGSHVSFVLIPLRRDYEIAAGGAGASSPSAGGMLHTALDSWLNMNQQRDRTSPKIHEAATKWSESIAGRFGKDLHAALPRIGDFSLDIVLTRPVDYRIFLEHLGLRVMEGGYTFPLSEVGSGTQSLAIFALYVAMARVSGSTYILGFEEPEQNLHPQAQRQLVKALVSESVQSIFTTHSPVIVDALTHEEIALCRKPAQDQAASSIRQVPGDFFESASMDREKYYKFHSRKNSEFLFANFVVVVESPIDAAVLHQMMLNDGVDIGGSGGTFLSLDGVTSIDYVYHLLGALEIPAIYVVDKDYFIPYLHGDRKPSLHPSTGMPRYSSELREDCVLAATLEPREAAELGAHLARASRESNQWLAERGFYTFKYALEVDLLDSPHSRSKMISVLAVNRSWGTKDLMTEVPKMLKKQENLLEVMERLSAKNLPASYSRIRRAIIALL